MEEKEIDLNKLFSNSIKKLKKSTNSSVDKLFIFIVSYYKFLIGALVLTICISFYQSFNSKILFNQSTLIKIFNLNEEQLFTIVNSSKSKKHFKETFGEKNVIDFSLSFDKKKDEKLKHLIEEEKIKHSQYLSNKYTSNHTQINNGKTDSIWKYFSYAKFNLVMSDSIDPSVVSNELINFILSNNSIKHQQKIKKANLITRLEDLEGEIEKLKEFQSIEYFGEKGNASVQKKSNSISLLLENKAFLHNEILYLKQEKQRFENLLALEEIPIRIMFSDDALQKNNFVFYLYRYLCVIFLILLFINPVKKIRLRVKKTYLNINSKNQ